MLRPGWVRYMGTARRYSGTMLGSVVAGESCEVWSVSPAETERVNPTPAARSTAKAVKKMRPMRALAGPHNWDSNPVHEPAISPQGSRIRGSSTSILRDQGLGICDSDHRSDESHQIPKQEVCRTKDLPNGNHLTLTTPEECAGRVRFSQRKELETTTSLRRGWAHAVPWGEPSNAGS